MARRRGSARRRRRGGSGFLYKLLSVFLICGCLVAAITLAAALIFHTTLKGVAKQLYVLLGMIVGYVVAVCFGMVDFAGMNQTIRELGVVANFLLEHETMERDAFLTVFGEKTHEQPENVQTADAEDQD